MTRDDLRCVVDQACVSNAAGPDYLWPGSPLEPRLWEALRIEMQSRYRRSTGETMAVLRVDLSEEACRTCDGTGKEGRHSLCRDCDDHQPPHMEEQVRDELRKRVMRAIFDPGATEGFKGDRDLTTWQTDAVMRALAATEAQPYA